MVIANHVELLHDDVLASSNKIKTHKNFADCRYDISLREIKIILGLISLTNQADNEFRTYLFSFSGMADFLGLKYHHRCKEIREIIEKLKTRTVILPGEGLLLKERPEVPWLARNQIAESKDFVELKLNPELAEVLLSPEMDRRFIETQMAIVLNMASTYSVKIYLQLKKNFWIDKTGKIIKNTFDLTIQEIRDKLSIPSNLYGLTANLKAKVLEFARKECEDHADLIFDLIPIKRGRSIVGFTFVIDKNPNYQPLTIDLKPISSRLTGMEKALHTYDEIINNALNNGYDEVVPLLIKHKVNKQGVAEIIKDCTPEQIKATIQSIEKSAQTQQFDNIAGVIRKACRETAATAPSLSEYDLLLQKQEKERKQALAEAEIRKAEAEAAAKREEEAAAEKRKQIENYITHLEISQFNTLIADFKEKAPEFLKQGFERGECFTPGTNSYNKLVIFLSITNEEEAIA